MLMDHSCYGHVKRAYIREDSWQERRISQGAVWLYPLGLVRLAEKPLARKENGGSCEGENRLEDGSVYGSVSHLLDAGGHIGFEACVLGGLLGLGLGLGLGLKVRVRVRVRVYSVSSLAKR